MVARVSARTRLYLLPVRDYLLGAAGNKATLLRCRPGLFGTGFPGDGDGTSRHQERVLRDIEPSWYAIRFALPRLA